MEAEESNHSMLDYQPGGKRAKVESVDTDRLLNFATAADEFELSLKRQKMPRDPMSHRIIEKRRRDRMNNCLADLSRLIPSSYHKQGQGRIEKTEIIEMAIKHINMLQQRVDEAEKKNSKEDKPPPQPPPPNDQHCCATKFYMGFKEAQDEVMRFLVEVESVSAMDPFCKKIMKHLENASKKFITEQIPHSPNLSGSHHNDIEKVELTGLENDNNSQSGFMQRSSMYQTPPSGTSQQDDQQMNMEAKHRDKHLRSLLAEQQHSVSSNNGSNNLSESASGSSGLVPLFSYSSHLSGMGANSETNGMGSSGYVSDLSNLEKTSPSGSTSSRDNVYKFKHNITKRFSQEGLHHRMQHHHNNGHPSDTSSSTSSRDLEDDQSQLKWKSNKHKGRHGGNSSGLSRDELEGQSGGNNSANSDEFNSGSVSNDCSRRRGMGKPGSHNNCDNNSSSVALPGFILHPQGTHYMPISVHNANISGLFENLTEHEGPPVFHPISIPVHFRRPVISMPNITICTHMSSQRKDRSVKE